MIDFYNLYYRFDTETGEKSMIELLGFVIPEYATTEGDILNESLAIKIGENIQLN